MSGLTRYPVPQPVAADKVAGPRLYFRLEPTVVPDPALDFLKPLQATKQGIASGKVEPPRLHFRLEPTVVPDPVLQFLRPLRGLEAVKAGVVNVPRLHFRLEAEAGGRIMSSLVGAGGLIGAGGLAGHGGGLIR